MSEIDRQPLRLRLRLRLQEVCPARPLRIRDLTTRQRQNWSLLVSLCVITSRRPWMTLATVHRVWGLRFGVSDHLAEAVEHLGKLRGIQGLERKLNNRPSRVLERPKDAHLVSIYPIVDHG